MEWLSLEAGPVSEYSSHGIHMTEAARLTVEGEFRVHVADFKPGGVLGRHPTRLWQLFHVVAGNGWVRGQDGQLQPIRAGQTVIWSPGEYHESGSDDGMSVVIAQASSRLPSGELPERSASDV